MSGTAQLSSSFGVDATGDQFAISTYGASRLLCKVAANLGEQFQAKAVFSSQVEPNPNLLEGWRLRIKIISDGTPSGTRVISSDTGVELEDVTGVVFQLSSYDALPRAWIGFARVEVDLQSDDAQLVPSRELQTPDLPF